MIPYYIIVVGNGKGELRITRTIACSLHLYYTESIVYLPMYTKRQYIGRYTMYSHIGLQTCNTTLWVGPCSSYYLHGLHAATLVLLQFMSYYDHNIEHIIVWYLLIRLLKTLSLQCIRYYTYWIVGVLVKLQYVTMKLKCVGFNY